MDHYFNAGDLSAQGQDAESKGDRPLAIVYYEQSVSMGFTGTFPYERLMVIYKTLKQPQNELRVIEKAIRIFTAENESRIQAAISRSQHNSVITELLEAHEKGEKFKFNGWYIYNPYPVKKWSKRMERVIKKIK